MRTSYELFGHYGIFDLRAGCGDGPIVGDGGVGDHRRTLPASDAGSEPIRRAIENAAGNEHGAGQLFATGDGGAGHDADCDSAREIWNSTARRMAIYGNEPGVCTGVRIARVVDHDKSHDD